MNFDVLNISGEKTGRSIELPEEIFGIEPNDHVLYLAVKLFQANQRQGTSKVKSRKEVKGSSRKLHRQKGTGGSRKGNIRNPLYKGGGSIFGPQPRGYGFKMNRREKDLAKISALSYKAKDNAILIVEDLKLEAPKTKAVAGMLQKLGVGNKKMLLVYPDVETNVALSLRNIPNAAGTILSDLNVYELVNADVMVLTESAAKLFIDDAA